MKEYPIEIETTHYVHRGGAKFYNITVIHNMQDDAVVVFRWGRVSQFGDVKVQIFKSLEEAERAATKKENEKIGRGYVQDGPMQKRTAEHRLELSRTIGLALFNKMGKTAVNHLDPGFDTSKMRDVDPPRFDEEGRPQEHIRKADISEQLRRLAEEERVEALKVYENNPLFGLF